jgi:hypothetical protein
VFFFLVQSIRKSFFVPAEREKTPFEEEEVVLERPELVSIAFV